MILILLLSPTRKPTPLRRRGKIESINTSRQTQNPKSFMILILLMPPTRKPTPLRRRGKIEHSPCTQKSPRQKELHPKYFFICSILQITMQHKDFFFFPDTTSHINLEGRDWFIVPSSSNFTTTYSCVPSPINVFFFNFIFHDCEHKVLRPSSFSTSKKLLFVQGLLLFHDGVLIFFFFDNWLPNLSKGLQLGTSV